MAQTILIKRSTSTAAPTTLSNGELAYSANSSKLFIGRPGGAAGDVDAIGGKFYTDIITAATSANTASKLVLRDVSGNFSAGTITAALAGNATTATELATARTITIDGDVDASAASFDGSSDITLTTVLDTVNSTVGAFGSASLVPIITVNGKGLVTSVTTAAISTSWTIAADAGAANAIDGGETLTVSGGTGVITTASDNAVSIAIGQDVATTSNVTFNNVAVDGTLTSDDIQATTLTASGHVIVTGDLTVNGTTTTVNSTAVALGDNIITLNSGLGAGVAPTANAGFEINRGSSTDVSLVWNETSNYWQLTEDGSSFSKIMTAGNFAAGFTGIIDGGTF